MAIFSMCSDLQTRETMWVTRKTDDAPQDRFAGQINPAEAYWWAARYAERYADNVVTWEG